jgi:hypothetical protein
MPSRACRRKSGYYPLPGSRRFATTCKKAETSRGRSCKKASTGIRSVAATPDQGSANRALNILWRALFPGHAHQHPVSFLNAQCHRTGEFPRASSVHGTVYISDTSTHMAELPCVMGGSPARMRERPPAGGPDAIPPAGSTWMSEKSAGSILRSRPRMDFASLQRAARNYRILAPLRRADGCT